MGRSKSMGVGEGGVLAFLLPVVLLEKQWLCGYFSEPVVGEMLQYSSVRGRKNDNAKE